MAWAFVSGLVSNAHLVSGCHGQSGRRSVATFGTSIERCRGTTSGRLALTP
jgi:hypothetical protein